MALLSNLDILNAACALFGADPLQSLEDDIGDNQAASLLYETVVDFNLGLYLFSFSKQLFTLSIDDALASPLSGYKHVFDLPPEAIGQPIYVTDNVKDPAVRFSRYVLLDGKVHADANPLFAMCRYRPDPHRWDALFKSATIKALASPLALSMASDRATAGDLYVQAYGTPSEMYRGGEMGAAIRADSFSTPVRTANFGNNPLTRAWGS